MRNIILRLGLVLIFLLLGGFVAGLIVVEMRAELALPQEMARAASRLGYQWETRPDQLYWIVAGLFAEGLLSFVAIWIMVRMFRKTTAPEVFFFSAFVVTLALDLAKAGQLIVALLRSPLMYGELLTRAQYFGLFLGLFCLISSSVYLSGVEYQKTGMVLAIAALLAFTLSYALPVDPTRLLPNLIHPAGDRSIMQALTLALGALVLLNGVYALAAVQERGYIVLLAALLLVVVGRLLVFYVLARPILYAAALGMLIAGVALFVWRIRQLYLWR
ncbi:MAG: hypothetical protein ACLFUM_04655 [Spirochaetaceae bacterium]